LDLDLNLAVLYCFYWFGCCHFVWPGLDCNWWYSFELVRNFRFSFETVGYCIDKSFLKSVYCVGCVYCICWAP